MKQFEFKQFRLSHKQSPMKIGTDAILLGALASVDKANNVLDIGTGCGIISLMLAQRNTNANIIGVDIDQGAIDEATNNFRSAPWSERLQAIQADIQEFAEKPQSTPLAQQHQFDLIVSNPPFFQNDLLPENTQLKSAKHNTLLSFEQLLKAIEQLLTPEGIFSLILPYTEGLQFIDLAIDKGFYLHRIVKILPKADKDVNRLVFEMGYAIKELTETELIVRDIDNNYSEAYQKLTAAFHPHF